MHTWNTPDDVGATPSLWSAASCGVCSPGVVRRLHDAGAGATSVCWCRTLCQWWGSTRPQSRRRPLRSFASKRRMSAGGGGVGATEERLDTMEGIRRSLLQVEAVFTRRPGCCGEAMRRRPSSMLRRVCAKAAPLLRHRSGRLCRCLGEGRGGVAWSWRGIGAESVAFVPSSSTKVGFSLLALVPPPMKRRLWRSAACS